MSARFDVRRRSAFEVDGIARSTHDEFLDFAAALGYSEVMAMFVLDGCRADGAEDPYSCARSWMTQDYPLFPSPRCGSNS